MSKRFKLIFILLLVGLSVASILPTVRWYFMTSAEERQLASGTPEVVRETSVIRAQAGFDELTASVRNAPDAAIAEEYAFLVDDARVRYEQAAREIPSLWTNAAVLSAYRVQNNRSELLTALELHYRTEILALKEVGTQIMRLGLDLSGGMSFVLQAEADSSSGTALTADERDEAVNRALENLNSRIDQFGLVEPQIRRQGVDRIFVDVPGLADPSEMQSIIMNSGDLTFHIVDDAGTTSLRTLQAQSPNGVLTDAQIATVQEELGPDIRVMGFYQKNDYGIDELQSYIAITAAVGLNGSEIQNANVNTDSITGRPLVGFLLTEQGGTQFLQLTEANVGKSLAVVLNGRVRAHARITEAIRDQVSIRGFDQTEADNLARVLRTGAMPVRLSIVNEQTVGASLGEDAIRAGLRAAAIGFLAVVLFMLVYYKGAGMNAVIALFLNIAFMAAVLAMMKFTLTLTSIGAMVLTIGMAVDANVIIYERIKEEYRLGKSRRACVDAGFKKAFTTILDSNVTTFISGLFLSLMGSGPIRGFGVTLCVGIVCSMFTALFVSRLIFDFSTDVLKSKKISIDWRRVKA